MKKILALGLLVVMAIGCRKDSLTEIRKKTDYSPEVLYRISIQGEVISPSGEAIAGATLTFKGLTTTSDDEGLFAFMDVDAGSRGYFIKATAPDYHEGGTMVYANSSLSRSARIILNPLKKVGSFETNTGGTINIDGRTEVEFAAGELIGRNGTYSGSVDVYATWLDPTLPSTFDRMPGDLSAEDLSGDRVALQTYGMTGVELRGSSGEILQPAPDRPATLAMYVPNTIRGEAPAEIPLWHFDAETGLWKEEGSAILQNDQYVGEVGHFSWWNCDMPYEPVYICIQLLNDGVVPLSNIRVYICAPDLNSCGSNMTDANGMACGWVWKGQKLNVTIYSVCGTVAGTFMIDPIFDTPDDPILIPVNLSGDYAFTLGGTVTDCDLMPQEDILVSIKHQNGRVVLRTAADGSYNYSGIGCEQTESVTVKAVDIANLKSDEALVDIAGPGNYTQDLVLCQNITEYLSYSVNGTSYVYVDCKAVQSNVETIIRAEDVNGLQLLSFTGFGTGTFTGSYIGAPGQTFPEDAINFTITRYDSVGGAIEGSFSGSNGNGDQISGDFKATRER